MKNFSNKQKLKEYSNAKPTLKEILKGLRQLKKNKTKQNKTKNHEELGWRKPQLESSDVKKPAYRPKHKDVGKKKKKERKKQKDIQIIRSGQGRKKNRFFFLFQ